VTEEGEKKKAVLYMLKKGTTGSAHDLRMEIPQVITSQCSPTLLSFEVVTVTWMFGHAASQVKVSSQDSLTV